MVSSKRGRLYLKFTLALALIAAVVYSYSVFASAPISVPMIVNNNGTLVNGSQIPNASVASVSSQLFFYSNFSSENASQEVNSTFKWFKRSMYQPQNRSLVGYWKLDGNANDSSQYGNGGTRGGNAAFDAANCKVDGCANFTTAVNNITITDSASLNLTQFTVEAWIRTSPLAGRATANMSIVAKELGVSNRNYALFVDNSSGNFSASSSFSGVQLDINSSVNVSSGTWRHVAYVVNSTHQVVYVDGVLTSNATYTGTADRQSSPVSVGKSPAAGVEATAFNGSIDEVAIYNYAKSAGEIYNDYINSTYSAMIYKDALAYWHFDSVSATNTTPDSSGKGNTGTLRGFNQSNATTAGIIGNGLQLDGLDDRVTFTTIPYGATTYSYWIKLNPKSTNYWGIFAFQADNAHEGLYFDGATQRLVTYLSESSAASTTFSAGVLDDGNWHHVVQTINGTNPTNEDAQRAWIDGVELSRSGGGGGGATEAWTALKIGINNDNYLNGTIDEIAIYNRTLSLAEIKELYLRRWYDYSPQQFLLHPNYPDEVDNSTQNTTLLMRFNDASPANPNVTDSSPYANNGNVTGAFFTNDSISGSALSFDGVDDYVITANNIGISGAQARTVSFWVKLNVASGGMVGWGGSSSNTAFVLMIQNGWYLWGSGGGNDWSTGIVPATGVWTHSAVTYDGTKAEWFINGASIGTFTHAYNTGNTQVIIGNRNILDIPLNGLIDEVKIVNRTLTAAEIAADYRKGCPFCTSDGQLPTTSSGVVWQPGRYVENLTVDANTTLYWRFDQGAGQNVTDLAGLHPGILGNDGNSANDDPTWTNDSVSGYALNFSSAASEFVNSSNIFNDVSAGSTYEFWVKKATAYAEDVFLYHYAGGEGFSVWSNRNVATGPVIFYPDGSNGKYSNVTIPAGRWVQLVLVMNPSGIDSFYMDGVNLTLYPLDVADGIDAANPANNVFHIGRRSWGGAAYFNGYIDEVRIINRSLSAAEVLADYRKQAKALGLLSNSYINFSNSGSGASNSATSFNEKEGTVEFWVKPEWNYDDGVQHAFFETEDDDAFNILKDQSSQGNDLVASVINPFPAGYVLRYDIRWLKGEWHYVAVTWNNYTSNMTLHVDGVQVNQSGLAFTIPPQKSFMIGSATSAPRFFPNATFSEFRISRKALTAQEINESFSKGRQLYSNEYLLNSSNYRNGDSFRIEYVPGDSQATTGTPVNSSILTIVNIIVPAEPAIADFGREGAAGTSENVAANKASSATPSNATVLTAVNITWSASADNDSDTIVYNVLINNSLVCATNALSCNTTQLPSWSSAAGTAFYIFNVTAFDGEFNSTTTTYMFNFDNSTPVLIIVPLTAANATFQNTTYSFLNFTVTDGSVDRFILNITGPSFSGTGGNGSLSGGRNISLWDKDLVAMWHFEEGNTSTTANDSSGFGNHGTLINMNRSNVSVWSGFNSSGRLGQGMAFDGINDYIDTGSTIPKGYAQFAFCGWFYPQSNISIYTPLGTYTSSTDVSFDLDFLNNGNLDFNLKGATQAWTHLLTAHGVYSPKQWIHVCGNWDGSTQSLYLNGVLNGSQAYADASLSNTQSSNLVIGAFRPGSNQPFNGTIDEVKIWKRALSAEEVSAEYNRTVSNYLVNHNFSSSSHLFSVNLTNLTDGNYSYFAWVNDSAGNVAATTGSAGTSAVGQRILSVDTVAPAISFIANTPANQSFLPNSWIFINTSENDAGSDHNDYSAFVDFNRSLVGYWRFENGSSSNAQDSSTYGNNGVLTGFGCTTLDCNQSSGWTSAGKRGKAMVFDGVDDYVSLPSLGIPTNGVATQMGWFYFAISASAKGNYNSLFRNLYQHDANNNIYILGTTDNFNVASVLTSNTWHHIAFTYSGDSSTSLLYVDGVPYSIGLGGAGHDIVHGERIGSDNVGTVDRSFNGSIDEVQIWNRVLSAQEVNASFNAGKYRLANNYTGLSDGNYSYQAFAVDAAGSINRTENRTFSVDTTAPAISIVPYSTANSSFINTTSIIVNTSVTETGESSAFIDFNRSLVGYWRFEDDGDTNASDSSTWGNNGSMFGFGCTTADCNLTGGAGGVASGFTSAGKRGKAMAFDGVDDFVNVSDSSSLDISGNLTVEAWVNPLTIFTTWDGNQIVDKGCIQGSTQEGYSLFLMNDGAFFCLDNVAGTGGQTYIRQTVAGKLNKWIHVAGTYDGTTMRIYIDGTNINNTALSGSIITNNNPLGIGRAAHANEDFFNGSIDEVKIWSRALSAEEINASYQAGTYRLNRTFGGLVDGNYSYYAGVVDSAGNVVQTVNRTVVVDTKGPAISFIANTPANQSFLPNSWIYINTSENDAGSDHNDYSAFVDFNRSLVGYWRFEDTGNGTHANDSSSYGNNGAMTGFGCTSLDCNSSSGWTSAGKRGKGMVFDGINDYVDLGNPTSLRTTGALTVELWAKNGTSGAVASKWGDPGGRSWAFHLDNALYFRISNDAAATAPRDYTSDNAYASTPGWYHIVYTVVPASDNPTFYVNGVAVAGTKTGAAISAIYDSTTNVFIGKRDVAGNEAYFNGSIDEVKIWNRALSAQEINASFSAGIYRLYNNYTGLSDGNYSYQAFVVDAAGSINRTDNRTFGVDTVAPTIAYVAPTAANNSFINTSYTVVNTSVTESGESSAFVDFNNSLVGYWRFEDDGDTNASDSSTWGNNGSMFGFGCTTADCNLTGGAGGVASGFTSAGKRGRAMAFDGVDDYVDVGRGTSLNFGTSDFTVEGWIKFSKFVNAGAFSSGGVAGTGSGTGWQLGIDWNYLAFCMSGACVAGTTTASLTTNTWYHLVGVRRGANASIFLNGVNVTNVATSFGNLAASVTSGANTTIGEVYTTHHNGSIDEVKIWSRALSAEEINASYQAGAYRLERNFSGLPDGNYSFNVSVVDWAGNLFMNGTRLVVVDTVFPTISFGLGSDVNGSSLARNYVHLNVTVAELYGHNITASLFSGSTLSALQNVSVNTTPYFNNVTFLSVSDGYYNVSVLVKDMAGNVNITLTNRSFTVDTTQPLIDNGTNTNAPGFRNVNWAFVNYTFTELNNDTMYIRNGTGGVVTNTTPNKNATYSWYNFTSLNNANYTFSGWINDTAGRLNTTTNTSIVIDTVFPTVDFGLGSDVNGSSVARSYIHLNVSVGDLYGHNITASLFSGSTLSALQNVSVNTTPFFNNVTFLSVADGYYNVSVLVKDMAGNVNITLTNRSFTVDTTQPLIDNGTNTNAPGFRNVNWAFVNYTFTEINNDTMYIRNGTGGLVTNTTPNKNTTYFWYNFTSLNNANYTFSGWINDTAGRLNTTTNTSIVIDTVFPTVDFGLGSDVNGSSVARNYVHLNVTVAELYGHNITASLFSGSTLSALQNVSVNTTPFFNNVTFLSVADGYYNVTIKVKDLANNTNTSVSRSITVDTTVPTLSYAAPSVANASFVNVSWIFLNFSFVEINNDTFMIRNGSTNWTNVNASSGSFFYNFTSLPDGNYTFFGWVNDSAGNVVQTVNRTVVVDTKGPDITYDSSSFATTSIVKSVTINVTSNDTNNDHNDYSAFVNFNNSLVGYWRFEDDGDTNASDFTNYNNNGTLVGFGCTTLDCNLTGGSGGTGSGWTSGGKRGKAMVFDGQNDYVAVLNSANLNITNNITVEAWVKLNSINPNAAEYIVAKSNANALLRSWALSVNTDGTVSFYIRKADDSASVSVSGSAIAAGAWYHLVGTFDGTNLRIYNNGVLSGTDSSYSGAIQATPFSVTIGATQLDEYWVNGTIDEVKVWNRSLSASEINASYNAGRYNLLAIINATTDSKYANGNFSYTAYVVDAAGNINRTEERMVVLDNTPPVIAAIRTFSNMSGRHFQSSNTTSAVTAYFNSILPSANNDGGGGQEVTVEVTYTDLYRNSLSGNLTFGDFPANHTRADPARIAYTIETGLGNATAQVSANDTANNTASVKITFRLDINDTVTTDNSSNSSYWVNTNVTINLTAVDRGSATSGANRTLWCSYTAGTTACTPTIEVANPVSFSLPLNCSVDTSCTVRVRYYSIDNVSNNESGGENGGYIKESNTVNIATGGSDVQDTQANNSIITNSSYVRASNLTNSTVSYCRVTGSVVSNAILNRNFLYRFNCSVSDSWVLDSNLTSAIVEKQSYIDPSTIIDSVITNSTIRNASISFSRVENSTFCGNFTVWSADILNNTLVSGRLEFNNSIYFGPRSLASICSGGAAPSPVGQLVAEPSIVNNSASVTFRYAGEAVGYAVSIQSSELAKLDSTSTTAITLTDNGVPPDSVANDAVYAANYSISASNANADGNKTIFAQVSDGVGNNWTVRTNVTLDNTPPYAAIVINSNNMNTTSAVVTLNLTSSDAIGVKDCRFANEDRVFGNYETCPTTKVWALSSGNGLKTVVVQARDSASNVNETNDTITLLGVGTVIVSPQSNEIIRGSKLVIVSAPDSAAWVTFNVTNASNSSHTWNLAGTASALTNDTNPADGFSQAWTTTAAAFANESKFNLTVISYDASGNQLSNDTKTNIEVDNSPPNVTLDVPNANGLYHGVVSVNASASSDTSKVRFEYRRGTGDWTVIGEATSPPFKIDWSTTGLSDGTNYEVRANATDDAGLSANVSNANIEIDNTAPTITINNPTAGTEVSGTINITFTILGTVHGTEIQFDGGSWATANDKTYHLWDTAAYTDTTHSIRVKANDSVNNTGYSDIRIVTVDNGGAPVILLEPLSGGYKSGNVDITVSSPGTTFNVTFNISNSTGFFNTTGNISAVTVDNESSDGWSAVWVTTRFAEDSIYTVSVRAYSASNSLLGTDSAITIEVDNLIPANVTTINITDSPTDTDGSLVINWTSTTSADIDHYNLYRSVTREFNISTGTLLKSVAGNVTTDNVPAGTWFYKVTAVDNVGRESNASPEANTTIDLIGPTGTLDINATYARDNNTIKLVYTGSAIGFSVVVNASEMQKLDARVLHDFETLWETSSNNSLNMTLNSTTTKAGSFSNELRANTTGALGQNITVDLSAVGAVNLSRYNRLLLWVQANTTGTLLNLSFGNSNYTELANATFTIDVQAAGVWEQKVVDVSHIPMLNRTAIRYLMFNVTTATPFRLLLDDLEASNQISLADNGLSGDDVASDAKYTAVYNITPDNNVSDGSKIVKALVNDGSGNFLAPQDSVTLDNTMPSGAVLINEGDLFTITRTVTLNLTFTDATSGVKDCRFSNTEPVTSSYESCQVLKVWTTTTGGGTKTVYFEVRDNAGNTNISIDTIVLDTAVPLMLITSPLPGVVVNGTVNVSFTGAESTQPQISFDGGNWTNTTTSTYHLWNTTNTSVIEGTHGIRVRDTDAAGNIGYSETLLVRIDNIPGVVTFLQPQSNAILVGNVTVIAVAPDNTRNLSFWLYNTTSGRSIPVYNDTSPVDGWNFSLQTALFEDGIWDLYVNATDDAGIIFDTSVVGSLRFDNIAPSATLQWPSNGATVRGTVTINVTASSDAKQVVFEYSNNSGNDWQPIGIDFSPSGGWTFAWFTTALNDASTYRVRANVTDYAALSAIAQNTADFAIDNTPPTITINTPTPGSYVNSTTTINFTGNESANSEVRFDGGAWLNITNSTSYAWNTTAYNDGTHTIQVRNNDSVGNTGYSNIVSVIVDNAKPTPLITYPLSNSTIRGNITVLITAPSDTARIEFYVDNNTGSGWVLRRTDTNKEDGWSFVWDTAIECASECSGARIRANATDASGLKGNFTVSGLEIDNAAPTVTLLYPPNSATIRGIIMASATSSSDTTQVVFEYSSDSGTTWYTIGIDPSSAGGWNITWNTNEVVDGTTYRVRANATDNAGLSGTDQNTADFTIDNVAAATTIISPKAGSVISGNFTVTAIAPDAAFYVLFRVFNGSGNFSFNGSLGFTNDSSPADGWAAKWNTSAFADGMYNLSAVAYDVNNNYVSNGTELDIRVDNNPPAAVTLTPLQAFFNKNVIALNWSPSSSSDVAYYNVYRSNNVSFTLAGALLKNVSGNTTADTVLDGQWFYKVTAVDTAGRESAPSNEVSVTVMTGAPPSEIFGTLYVNDSIVNNGSSVLFYFMGSATNLNVTINLTEMGKLDNTSGALMLNDSGINGDVVMDDATYSAIYAISMLNNISDGVKQLTAEANDSAGNLFRASVNITLDNAKPNVSVFINDNLSATIYRLVKLTVSANDTSGIDVCRFANEDRVFGIWESCASSKVWQLSTSSGNKTVVVQAVDRAGNVQEANDTIELKLGVPLGPLTVVPSIVKNGDNLTFYYESATSGLTAVINVTELQNLDNTSTQNMALHDDGVWPDNVAIDGIHTANYTIGLNNNVSDGMKRLTATVNDTEGNVFRPAVNITLDNTRPNASVSIVGLSPAGFANVSSEYTFSRAVTLLISFNDSVGIGNCRFANENQVFTDWEGCTAAKSWLLSDGNGNKTAIVEVRDSAGNVNRTNDTIFLNTTGAGIDLTPPTGPTVVDDGTYTKFNSVLHAKWNATDYENELLHIPLEWEYRIAFDNFTRRISETWQYAGQLTEATVYSLNLSDGANYTFEVRAVNTGGLRSSNGTSDGIIVDTSPPTAPSVNSTVAQNTWTSNNVVSFNWSAADNISGISDYSYALDTNVSTVPDNVPETENEHASLASSYNDGKLAVLKFNSTGNASAVFVEVKSNVSANDVLRVTLQLAEASAESADAMGLRVYVITAVPTAFAMNGSNVSLVVDTSHDVSYASFMSDASSYTVDVPIGTAVTGSQFFVAVAGDVSDDGNRHNLLLAVSNTSLDSSIQTYQCGESSGCSNTTGTAAYAVKVELRDVKQDSIWDRTYTVGDGRLYFHIKARDKAGNFGAVANYTVLVDTTPPSVPQMNQTAQYTNTTSATFNWTPSSDADSGVSNYSLQVDNNSDFSSPEFYGWTGNVTNYTATGLVEDAIYYARVHSRNLAGVNSSWSSSVSTTIDTTAPSITFSKPSSTGVVAKQDVALAVNTNENAVCSYRTGADPYATFTFTNSTYHETRISASTGSNSFDVQCKDTILNTGTATITFTVSTTATASSLTLQSLSAFTGDVVQTNVLVYTAASQRIGEIDPAAFSVKLNGDAVGASVFDNGAGNYTLMFDAPVTNGTYTLRVDVGSATASATLNVQALLFTVQYVQNGVSANTGDRLIYFVAGNFTLGLATDSKNIIRSSTSSALNLTSDANYGNAYIFVTRTSGNVERVESLLKERTFLDAINPSFGYAIDQDLFVVYTDLEYDDIALSGNKTLTTGRYNLIVENKGFDSSLNKTKLEVRVQ